MYCKSVLDNGLRIVSMEMPHTRSVSMGVFIGVGSRYERADERGISHFVEHMLFKGTAKRPTAQAIAEIIETLGGELNAGTGNEVTTYYSKVASHHLPIALDVLLDMLRHSRFDAEEVERERKVILQEINQLMDTPESWVHVLMGELLWPDHPLGWEIAGTRESVSSISVQNIVDYVDRSYLPSNTVISVAGNMKHASVVAELNKELGSWKCVAKPAFLPAMPLPSGPAMHIEFKETEQAHLCLGVRGLSFRDPDYYPLRLLNVILGDGMSSRLWLDIREKRGLAYSVGSYTTFLADTGSLILFAGAPLAQVGEVIQAMLTQLDLLRWQIVPQVELHKAKEYLKGHMLLSMEDTYSNAQWFARQEVLDMPVLTVDQVVERLDAVSAEDVQRVALQLFTSEQLRLAALGPFKDDDRLSSMLKL